MVIKGNNRHSQLIKVFKYYLDICIVGKPFLLAVKSVRSFYLYFSMYTGAKLRVKKNKHIPNKRKTAKITDTKLQEFPFCSLRLKSE